MLWDPVSQSRWCIETRSILNKYLRLTLMWASHITLMWLFQNVQMVINGLTPFQVFNNWYIITKKLEHNWMLPLNTTGCFHLLRWTFTRALACNMLRWVVSFTDITRRWEAYYILNNNNSWMTNYWVISYLQRNTRGHPMKQHYSDSLQSHTVTSQAIEILRNCNCNCIAMQLLKTLHLKPLWQFSVLYFSCR